MTHEIMNSIAPISSLADTLQALLEDYRSAPESYPIEVEDLQSGIASINNRSKGLMKFAKTYRSLHKVTHLNLHRVKVKELFDNIKNLMQPSFREKELKLDFVLESADMEIEIDSYLIEQVLLNLLLNALDAVQSVTHARVVIYAKRNLQQETILRVTDNGTGIPPEILDSIFVPFFTTKKNGSGIGLSLCKQIMMLHKGKIHVNSVPGKGSAISLVFSK
jgi:signal transduction histidine kinase